MKAVARKLCGSVGHAFFIWAILLGPMWSKNLTLFLIWIGGASLVFLTLFFFLLLVADPEKIVQDPDNQKRFSGKLRHLWKLPPMATALVLAAQGWTFTAIFWTLTLMGAYTLDVIVTAGVKEELEKKADAEVPEV